MATPKKANPQITHLPKKPYSQEDIAWMNSLLQKTTKEMESRGVENKLSPYQTPINDRPRGGPHSATYGYRKPFRNHPPLVQERAQFHLDKLMAKHGHKIAKKAAEGRQSSANGHYGCLVAAATNLAKVDLGLVSPHSERIKKGRYRRNLRSGLKVKLGIKDQDFSRTPRPAAHCSVTQGNLEGI